MIEQFGSRTALVVAGRGNQSDIAELLRGLGFTPLLVDGSTIEKTTPREGVSLCLVDLRENGEAMRVARTVRTIHPKAVLIGVADPDRPATAADAIRAGVFDVLPRPPTAPDLRAMIANAREQAALSSSTSAPRTVETASYGIVGSSPAMRVVMDVVQRAAPGRCGILIAGERGSGREMIARAIHAYGTNHNTAFVKVDCSSIAGDDLEMQLFGVVQKGSRTHPMEQRALERINKRCRLLDATGGILFFENIAEMPARVQARLVRVLRDREVFVGEGRDATPIDIRPIAAVDGSLEIAVDEGRLRAELAERLSLVKIELPALRQRREDIPVLAMHFLKDLCTANGKPIKTLTRPALTLLSALPWRGNAPELRALLERLILLVPGGLIRLEDVLAHIQLEGSVSPSGLDATLRQARAKFERDYIAAVLQHHRGRIADAARILGIQRTNLYRKMRRLNLMRPRPTSRDW